MPRSFSLTMRESLNTAATERTLIYLMRFSHEDWDDDVLLASDYTVRTSNDPLKYGVVSNDETFDMLIMSGTLPDDDDGASPFFQLTFANLTDVADAAGVDLGDGLSGLVRSISATTPASVEIYMVMADTPDDIEMEISDFFVTKATISAQTVTIDVSTEAIDTTRWPYFFRGPDRRPGLFR